MSISDEELHAILRAVRAAYDTLGDGCEVIILIKPPDTKVVAEVRPR